VATLRAPVHASLAHCPVVLLTGTATGTRLVLARQVPDWLDVHLALTARASSVHQFQSLGIQESNRVWLRPLDDSGHCLELRRRFRGQLFVRHRSSSPSPKRREGCSERLVNANILKSEEHRPGGRYTRMSCASPSPSLRINIKIRGRARGEPPLSQLITPSFSGPEGSPAGFRANF
jgi:hypothetical protein